MPTKSPAVRRAVVTVTSLAFWWVVLDALSLPLGVALGGTFVLGFAPVTYLELAAADAFDFDAARDEHGTPELAARFAVAVLGPLALVVGCTLLVDASIASAYPASVGGDVRTVSVPAFGFVFGFAVGRIAPLNVFLLLERDHYHVERDDESTRSFTLVLSLAASAVAYAVFTLLSADTSTFAALGSVGRYYAIPLAIAVATAAVLAHAVTYRLGPATPTGTSVRRIGIATVASVLLALVALAPIGYVWVALDAPGLWFATGVLGLFVLLPASIYAGPVAERRLR